MSFEIHNLAKSSDFTDITRELRGFFSTEVSYRRLSEALHSGYSTDRSGEVWVRLEVLRSALKMRINPLLLTFVLKAFGAKSETDANQPPNYWWRIPAKAFDKNPQNTTLHPLPAALSSSHDEN